MVIRQELLEDTLKGTAREDIRTLIALLDALRVRGRRTSTTPLREQALNLGESSLAQRASVLAIRPLGDATKAKAMIAAIET